MARPFRRHHDDVQIGTRHHLVVVNVEAVREGQRGALLDVRLDVVVIDGGNVLVRQEHHDHIGILHCFRYFLDLEAGFLDLLP